VFRYSGAFNPNDPDYRWMHRKVQGTLEQTFGSGPSERRHPSGRGGGAGNAHRSPSASPTPGAGVTGDRSDGTDPCGYRPVG
jgi:hypothetical protein